MTSLSDLNPETVLKVLNCVGDSVISGPGSLGYKCGISTTGTTKYPQTSQEWDNTIACFCDWTVVQGLPMAFNQCGTQVAVQNPVYGNDAVNAAQILSFSHGSVCAGYTAKSCKPTTLRAGLQTLPSIFAVVASLKQDQGKLAAACTKSNQSAFKSFYQRCSSISESEYADFPYAFLDAVCQK